MCKQLDAFADALADAFLKDLARTGPDGIASAAASAAAAGGPKDGEDDDDDDFFGPEDESLSLAQDALMQCDYDSAEKHCREVLERRKCERDAYELLNLCARSKNDLPGAIKLAREWVQVCGADTSNTTAMSEAAFLAEDPEALREAANLLKDVRPSRRQNADLVLKTKVTVASLLSEFDVKLEELERLMASCVGLDVGDEYAQLIDVLAAYADRRHDKEGATSFFKKNVENFPKLEAHTFEWDVALLGRALYALWILDEEGSEACKKLLDTFALPKQLEPEDPNIAAILALLNKDDVEFRKKCIDVAKTGCNIIFLRRLSKL